MLIYEDTAAVVASRAYELAQTGTFADFVAIERELVAEGFVEEVGGIKRPPLENALNAICAARRQDRATRER